jgi:uncharacterized protein YndB with AHSA1/START domain
MQAGIESKKPEFETSRTFDAPVALVWEAWSRAEHVQRWFTPQPLTTPTCRVDLRTGGEFYLVMRMPDGTEFPMDARFTEVVFQKRIVFDAEIHDGLMVHTTVSFAEHDGKTTMHVRQVYSHDAPPVRGAPMGWAATLDQLAAHLRERG